MLGLVLKKRKFLCSLLGISTHKYATFYSLLRLNAHKNEKCEPTMTKLRAGSDALRPGKVETFGV